MDKEEKTQILESILFIENKPVSYQELMGILDVERSIFLEITSILTEKYANRSSGLEILDQNQYLSIKPKDTILDLLKERYKGLQEKKLTPTMLSVLGIIAYKGPLTKAEIDQIRGIDSSYSIKRLLHENLIKLSGKKDIIGNPNLYNISDNFLSFFGLKSLKELPNIEDFQSLYTAS